ncbi:hypothetical protein ACFORJ_06300 [Corynebacterium hansenii]|uniref:Uncharacterized protein n=1 Tax=Corynebacterium hansenii TaxID=394964 RepID=A0ABV7ZNE4_9CORY|nr:hypothetical protein [Corynebacterium hansenii]WJZ00357.1 hypothetical protein CHAN_08745 [Corynebacterium hansenii]
MTYTNYSDELDLMLAVGVPVTVRTPINARPPRRWATAATWATLAAAALALTLWIGHQADQHLAAALDAGWG